MLSPRDLGPIVNILRIIVGIVLFLTLQPLTPTATYRKRFWLSVAVICGAAITGLRPLWSAGLDTWAGYGSLFQFLFNIAVAVVLVVRYRLYMPQPSEHMEHNGASPT